MCRIESERQLFRNDVSFVKYLIELIHAEKNYAPSYKQWENRFAQQFKTKGGSMVDMTHISMVSKYP